MNGTSNSSGKSPAAAFAYSARLLNASNAEHAQPCTSAPESGTERDVIIEKSGKQQRMLGRGGKDREMQILRPFTDTQNKCADSDGTCSGAVLPVLIGSGVGYALSELLNIHDGPVAVIDKEQPIVEATGCAFGLDDRVLWIADTNPQDVIAAITRWQIDNDGLPLCILSHPFYLRLDREYYAGIRDTLSASGQFDFWAQARYPKFCSTSPRLLLITSQYFLMGEIVTACDRLNIPYYLLELGDDEIGQTEFVERLLKAVLEFKPDFAFTINHLGVDREGVLTGLLDKLQLPLASWFVDNPHLILYMYSRLASPCSAIFTWDADNIASLKEQGFEHVFHLPLGTDPERFARPASIPLTHPLKSDVSFVGNSMVYKVGHRMKAGKFPRQLLTSYKDVAAGFAAHDERSVRIYLQQHHPDLHQHFGALDSSERRLAYETMITWEATRQYRARCVEQTLPFSPVIVGDNGWRKTFKGCDYKWKLHPAISYYTDLPIFYPLTTVNFNCTSKQMKGAVNQRVFDVPATGSFVLTDWREQMDELFEPDTEVVCYHEPEEAGELIRFYLNNDSARMKVVEAARKRVLAEHTYEHRVTEMVRRMRETFG